jgi:RNA polymerase sigma-70 factor, ECF subfamily
MLALRPDGSDGELVTAARKGDAEAFRVLYDRHVGGVYALARSVLGGEEGADDAVQIASIRAWSRLRRLRDANAFRVWVRQIARRAALDELRRRRGPRFVSLDEMDETGDEPAAGGDTPEGLAVATEVSDRIRSAIDSLPEHHRTVVVLHHLDGLEVREVAEVLGVPFGTVLSRLARARETLHRKLAGVVDDAT